MRRHNSRATLAKVLLAGFALVATQISMKQFKVVRRVISEQLIDLQLPIYYDAEVTIQPSRQDGLRPQPPERQEDTRSHFNKNHEREALLHISPKGYAEVPKSISRNATTETTRTRRAMFHPDAKFSEKLRDQFVQGAKDDADFRRIRQQKAKLQRERNKKAKKRMNKQKKNIEKVPLKVPYPIFVPSLPKSGTTTAHKYFSCGGQNSVHLAARTEDSIFKVGRCAQRNVEEGRPPFAGCGDYDVWTDTGYVATRYRKDNPELKQDNIQCYYPLIDALEETYTAYPNATFLFVVRETESWLDSMQSYHEGFIMDVWKRCRTQGFPGLDGTVEDFRDFYEWHKEMIRKFAMDHPSLTYIEVELEAEETGDILQEQVGINASCWGHYNQQKTEKASKTTSSNEMDEMDSEETSLI